MDFCRIVDRLYAAVPVRPFRDWLIRVHMDRCPRCQARLLSRDEAKSLLVAPGQLGGPEALWRRISREAGRGRPVPVMRPSGAVVAFRWASVASMAAAVILTGFWLLREIERPGPGTGAVMPAVRFEIAYINVGGTPAQTFVYQPQGSDTVLVWASKTP